MNAILDKVPTPPSRFTTLLIDAMNFHAAKNCCEAAKMFLKGIGKARKAFSDLRSEEAGILERYESDSWKA